MESNNLTDIQKSPFLFLQDHPWDYYKPISNVLNNSTSGQICDEETFFRTFMSEMNREYINLMIRKTIYNNSCDNYIVRDQKREHLELIMKGIYNDHAQHLPFKQKEQMETLNKLVIDYCVKAMLPEIESRFNYIRDKFSPLNPLPPPINTSSTGSKAFLPTISTVYKPNLQFNKTSPKSSLKKTINSQQSNNVFNNKILSSPPIDTRNLSYKPYYFTDERTNMFAKEKAITTERTKATRFYTSDFDSFEQSYPKIGYSNYRSEPAPAPVNYYIPESHQSRIRY